MKFLQNKDLHKALPLLILIILNIIIRIPLDVNYIGENGSDISMFCLLAESILTKGMASWLLHPASIFGLADYSYPSFAAFFLALVSSITGLTRLDLLIPLSYIIGVLCVLVGYIVGYAYSRDSTIAFFTAFAFSLNPLVIQYTRIWSLSRIFFLLFSMIIFCLVLKNKSGNNFKFSLLLLMLSFAEMMSHRMSLVLFFILIVAYCLFRSYSHILGRLNETKAKIIFRYEGKLFLMVSFLAFLFIFTKYYPFKNDLTLLQKGLFFNGQSNIIILLNMMVDYLSGLNPLIVSIALIGLMIFINNENKTNRDRLLLFILLLSIPLLSNPYYVIHLLIPIVSLFFALSAKYIMERISNNVSRQMLLSISFILILAFSLFMSTPLESMVFYKKSLLDKQADIGMPQTAKYVSKLNGNIIAENNFISRILMLYGQKPVFPFMGPEYPIYYNNYFDNSSFNLSISNYLKTNMYYLFKQNRKYNIDTKPKYIYSQNTRIEIGANNKIFVNLGERIYQMQ